MEPALSAVAALQSPSTGIIDSHAFMLALLGDAEDAGAALALHTPVRPCRGDRQALRRADAAAPSRCGSRPGSSSTPPGCTPPGWRGAHRGPRRRARPGRPAMRAAAISRCPRRAPFSRLIYPAARAARARRPPDARPRRAGPLRARTWSGSSGIDYTVDPRRGDGFDAAIRRYWPGLPTGALCAGLCRHPPEDRAARRPGRRTSASTGRRRMACRASSTCSASSPPGSPPRWPLAIGCARLWAPDGGGLGSAVARGAGPNAHLGVDGASPGCVSLRMCGVGPSRSSSRWPAGPLGSAEADRCLPRSRFDLSLNSPPTHAMTMESINARATMSPRRWMRATRSRKA